MNGHSKYAKISKLNIPKSTSVDISTLHAPPQTPKPTPNHSCRNQEIVTKQFHDTKSTATHDMIHEKVREEEVGEIFGVILSRSCSVSSHGLKAERQNSALESAVKRAFSMSRSSSVSEGYCRIHHQSDFIVDDVKPSAIHTRKPKKKKGKIFQACRLLFGF